MKRRAFFKQTVTFTALPLLGQQMMLGANGESGVGTLDREMAASKKADAKGLVWYNPESWGIEGRAWGDESRLRYYDRFPQEAEKKVPGAVWSLSRHSAGMAVRFKSNANAIHVKYHLLSAELAMSHMPATGVSGVDLYTRDEQGNWRWVNCTKPSRQQMETVLIQGMSGMVSREFLMYLPLYNGVDKLEIGVSEAAEFEGLAPRDQASAVLFYGTSITHGACASRPGMCHPAILGRRLDRPVINLGFSGNGRMDASVAEYLAKLDLGVLVIDCLPNMEAGLVRQRCVPFVQQIRKAKANLPIVLVEDRRNANSWIIPSLEAHHDANHVALKEVYEKLKSEGITGLYYIEGDTLLGDDFDGTTDGSHPNDLGFYRHANVMEPVIRQALGMPSK